MVSRENSSKLQSQPPIQTKPGSRTVSMAIAIILLIVGLGVGAGATYALTHLPTSAQSTNALCYSLFVTNPNACASLCTSGQNSTLGMLLELSNTLSDQATRAVDSSTLAINDINSLLSALGCDLNVTAGIDEY